MLVNVTVGGKLLSIKVGEGQQSIKWLAGIILNRAKEMKLLREDFPDNNFIVSGLRNSSGQLLNPSDSIFEHSDGSSKGNVAITADVVANFESDEWGNPVLTPWQVNAFVHSESGLHWVNENEAWRERMDERKEELESFAVASVANPRARSAVVRIGDDFSPADLDSAFLLDWKQIKFSWLPNSPSALSTIASIEQVMKVHYSLVCQLFSHYCGSGEVGEKYGLTLLEFSHILHCSRIYNSNVESRSISEAFLATSRSASLATDRSAVVMTRSQFADALAFVAQQQKSEEMTIQESLEGMLEGPIASLWRHIKRDYFVYNCADPELPSISREFQRRLKAIFMEWCVFDASACPAVSLRKFEQLMTASSIAGTEEQTRLVTRAFWAAQLDPPGVWELPTLCFSEFVEAISHLSTRTISGSSSLTDAKKIRMAYNLLADIELDEGKSDRK